MYTPAFIMSMLTPRLGEYMLSALLQGEKGTYRRGSSGEDIGHKGYYGTDEAREKLWAHTVEETARG